MWWGSADRQPRHHFAAAVVRNRQPRRAGPDTDRRGHERISLRSDADRGGSLGRRVARSRSQRLALTSRRSKGKCAGRYPLSACRDSSKERRASFSSPSFNCAWPSRSQAAANRGCSLRAVRSSVTVCLLVRVLGRHGAERLFVRFAGFRWRFQRGDADVWALSLACGVENNQTEIWVRIEPLAQRRAGGLRLETRY